MSNPDFGSSTSTASAFDPLGLEEETLDERRARILMENDLALLWHLRQVRESKQITQAELAERMGISQPSLAAFENQSNDPKMSTIRRYAFALGVIVDHSVDLDRPTGRSGDWGSQRVTHLSSRRTRQPVVRAGWRA